MGEVRKSYIIVTNSERLGRYNRKGRDNIRMDIREIVWESVAWMHPLQDKSKWRAHVSTVMNLRLP